MVSLLSVCSSLVLSFVSSGAGSSLLVYCTGACASSFVGLRVFCCNFCVGWVGLVMFKEEARFDPSAKLVFW